MDPKRILVTGAEGFVGRHLLTALRAAFPHARIMAGTRLTADPIAPPILADADEVIAFDLLSQQSVDALVQTSRPDACVHLAAFSDVGASFADPDTAWAINVDGTRGLAKALLSIVPHCTMLYAGTADVYGLSFNQGHRLDEHALLRPANPYAASKASADLALGEMALRGLNIVRMRPLNHIGPGQSPRFAVSSFARQIARIAAGLQEPLIRTGSLTPSREFLDVRDVCLAYVALLRSAESLPPATIFNLSSEEPRTLQSILDNLLEISGVKATIETAHALVRPVDLQSIGCSASALRSRVGWQPIFEWQTTLEDILRDWSERVRLE